MGLAAATAAGPLATVHISVRTTICRSRTAVESPAFPWHCAVHLRYCLDLRGAGIAEA